MQYIDSKDCAQVVFKWSITRRYADVIKHVRFRDSDPALDYDTLFTSCKHFRNLNKLTLDVDASIHLFGTGTDEEDLYCAEDLGEEHFYRRQELHAIGHSIGQLDLKGPYAIEDLPWLLACFPSVSALDLEFINEVPGADAERLTACRRSIATLCNLRQLVLDDIAVDALILQDGPHVDWGFKSNLRSLEVFFRRAQLDAVYAFAAESAETLACLDLNVMDHDDTLDDYTIQQNVPPSLPFPQLRRLHLQGSQPRVEQLLNRLKTSPVISLDLTIDVTQPHNISIAALLGSALKLFKELKIPHITWINKGSTEPYSGVEITKLVNHAAKLGVALTLQPRVHHYPDRDTCEATTSARDMWHDGTARRCDGADEVLRFGLAQSARIRATGDIIAAEHLVEALKPMHASMLREKD